MSHSRDFKEFHRNNMARTSRLSKAVLNHYALLEREQKKEQERVEKERMRRLMVGGGLCVCVCIVASIFPKFNELFITYDMLMHPFFINKFNCLVTFFNRMLNTYTNSYRCLLPLSPPLCVSPTTTTGGGRGGLQEADRPGERQEAGVPPPAD